jgi:GxxExxY protein
MPQRSINELTEIVIGLAIEVHRELGPGLLESAYGQAMCYELSRRGLIFQYRQELPVRYKGVLLDCNYEIDLLVEDELIVELKSVERIHPVHEAQLLTYLKLYSRPVGLLINFNVPLLKDGLKRMVNQYREPSELAREL